jgi:hypothetical protein
MKTKNSQGLPVNIVVTLIIGIIIFGLGFAMFSKISKSGDEQIEELNSKIRTDLHSLECDKDNWICSPNYLIGNGKIDIFSIYVANQGDTNSEFKVDIKDATNNKLTLESEKCGSIDISYPSITIMVRSGESASIPFRVSANKIKTQPCSFVTTAILTKPTDATFEQKTPIIIRIK